MERKRTLGAAHHAPDIVLRVEGKVVERKVPHQDRVADWELAGELVLEDAMSGFVFEQFVLYTFAYIAVSNFKLVYLSKLNLNHVRKKFHGTPLFSI